MKRREFFKTALATAGTMALGSSALDADTTSQPVDGRKIASEADSKITIDYFAEHYGNGK